MNELGDLRREVENLRVLLNDERSVVAAELRKLEKRIERLEVGAAIGRATIRLGV